MRLRNNPKSARRAFTLLELVVILVVVGVLAGLLMPKFLPGGGKPSFVRCMQNLKNVAFAMQMMAADNSGNSLLQSVKAYSGKSSSPYLGEFPAVSGSGPDELWKLYLALDPYVKDPQTIHCPSDPRSRNPASWANYPIAATNPVAYYSASSNAFSYVLAVDARTESVSAILAGDSHLSSDPSGTDENPGQLELKRERRIRAETAKDLRWTKSRHAGLGVIAFSDGHAEVLTSARLRTVWANPTNQGTRIWLPN